MTGGSGVAHSEVSTPDTGTLHGVRLWTALPDAARHLPRSFVHHVPEVVLDPGTELVLDRSSSTASNWAARSSATPRPGGGSSP
jgi:redox-sensitive bicupin YhaK (pirin superfamily)